MTNLSFPKMSQRFLLWLFGIFAVGFAVLAQAQDYPSRAVRIIVPAPPGGATDRMGRYIAQFLSQKWGKSVVVENRPGAGNNVGAEAVARSHPDGYTVLLSHEGAMTYAPLLFLNLPYDPVKDFIPVTQIFKGGSSVLTAHPSLPVSDFAELVRYAKTNPGKLNYGSWGPGSPTHLAGELMKSEASLDIVHIPYKGAGPALAAHIAGEVQLHFTNVVSAMTMAKAGKLKTLAMGGERRSSLAPDVPTFMELGYPAVVVNGWLGAFVPTGTPAVAIDRIYSGIVELVNDPTFRQKMMIDAGLEPLATTPAEFVAFLARERERAVRIVRLAGLKPE